MKTKIEKFCKEHKLTVDQFYGKEKVGGSLDLSSVESIPEGFNPTTGGYLYWKYDSKHIGARVPEVPKVNIPDVELKWENGSGKYTKIDGIFCQIVAAHVSNSTTVISAKKINRDEFFFIATKDGFSAHGKTLEQAVQDMNFKVIAEKLKKDPINPDTEITVMYYRTLTGACDFGCRDFMQRNGLPFNIVKIEGTDTEKTVEATPMKAKDLLPILEKSNAYGLQAFKKLITW